MLVLIFHTVRICILCVYAYSGYYTVVCIPTTDIENYQNLSSVEITMKVTYDNGVESSVIICSLSTNMPTINIPSVQPTASITTTSVTTTSVTTTSVTTTSMFVNMSDEMSTTQEVIESTIIDETEVETSHVSTNEPIAPAPTCMYILCNVIFV